VDKRVINSKKVRGTHGNILGVLSSAGKLCTAFPSSHSQASTTSPALRSCRAKSPNEGVPPESSVSRLGRRWGPSRLLLLDVLPASSCAQHQPQNSVRPSPFRANRPSFPASLASSATSSGARGGTASASKGGHIRSAGPRGRKTMTLWWK